LSYFPEILVEPVDALQLNPEGVYPRPRKNENANNAKLGIPLNTVLLALVLALPQGTTTQIYHVRGDRDQYTGVVGEKQVEIITKDCLHKASDEQAGYYDLGQPGDQTIAFANSDSCKVVKFGERK
jgi:hypothetical protein